MSSKSLFDVFLFYCFIFLISWDVRTVLSHNLNFRVCILVGYVHVFLCLGASCEVTADTKSQLD